MNLSRENEAGSPSRAAANGQAAIRMQWGIRIPLRDGVHLNATAYLPSGSAAPCPSIVTLTPYVAQTYHEHGLYFATHGYPFLAVDVRGRGNSEGTFRPLIQEARDGYDVVEWLARQPYCNGQVAMWGGSYSGYVQWVTAKERPPHLTTIIPTASPYLGVDFPFRNNIASPYLMQWLTLVSGRTLQERIFYDERFWRAQWRHWFESGTAFGSLDTFLGHPSATFQEWISHPKQDAYWDRYNPTARDYARMTLPVLTITGIYDADQPGALKHYLEHLKHCSAEVRAKHYLVIGPWDHAGTRAPQPEIGGVQFGPQSLVDLGKLRLDWYDWITRGGARPEFLQERVAYYVTGADRWRYADSLEAITAEYRPFYLSSTGSATSVFASGALGSAPGSHAVDFYVYDPRDRRIAEVEAALAGPLSLRPTFPTDHLQDQTRLLAHESATLIYHSAPFERAVEIGGFFKLTVWIAIDQPDTDFRATVYEIGPDGVSMLLTSDCIRARYRESLRQEKLIGTKEPLRYDFENFTFTSRLIEKGSRLRLVIGAVNSIYFERNYNTGATVAEDALADARAVTVELFHGTSHPSVLRVPLTRADMDSP